MSIGTDDALTPPTLPAAAYFSLSLFFFFLSLKSASRSQHVFDSSLTFHSLFFFFVDELPSHFPTVAKGSQHDWLALAGFGWLLLFWLEIVV
jgi:hypothetical protein